MIKRRVMNTVLVLACILIIIGVLLSGWNLENAKNKDVIKVFLKDGETEIVSFDGLGLVPGASCEYIVKFVGDGALSCDVGFNFVELSGAVLKDYARVKILANGEVLYDELLATAFQHGDFSLQVDFPNKVNTELNFVYYLPIEVGNEVKNADAFFELHLTAENE